MYDTQISIVNHLKGINFGISTDICFEYTKHKPNSITVSTFYYEKLDSEYGSDGEHKILVQFDVFNPSIDTAKYLSGLIIEHFDKNRKLEFSKYDLSGKLVKENAGTIEFLEPENITDFYDLQEINKISIRYKIIKKEYSNG